MIIVQLILFCMIFTLMVGYAFRGGAINSIYFYPKPVQEQYPLHTDLETGNKEKVVFILDMVCGG